MLILFCFFGGGVFFVSFFSFFGGRAKFDENESKSGNVEESFIRSNREQRFNNQVL